MIRIRSIAALLCVAALGACGEAGPQDITSSASGARVKFFNFGMSSPSVNFYADDTKLTGVLTTGNVEPNTGTAYGSVGSGGFYSELTPGAHTLAARSVVAADNGAVVASVPATIEDGKSYSFYMSGAYNATTKKTDAFVVEDNYPAKIDFTVAQVRFVNAISNSAPMTLYAKSTTAGSTEVAVGALVPYKGAGAFVALPGGTYDLSTRVAGSSTNAIVRTGVSFANGRVYTIASRGDITITSTTAANRPQLDNTANR